MCGATARPACRTARYAIDDVAFDGGGNVTRLAMRWSLRCLGATGVNRGSIEWNTRTDEPQHDVSPRSVPMGVLLPHALTPPQTITVSNAGTTPLHVGAVTASDSTIALSNDTCSGTTIAVGGSCTVMYSLDPDGSTAVYSGAIVVPDSERAAR